MVFKLGRLIVIQNSLRKLYLRLIHIFQVVNLCREKSIDNKRYDSVVFWETCELMMALPKRRAPFIYEPNLTDEQSTAEVRRFQESV